MVDLIQKQDLAASSFSNNNSLAAGGVAVRTNVGSDVGTAIAAAIAAIPSDKFLQGLQSYNATTNVMTLALTDGSTVPVDMTQLVADAVATVPLWTTAINGLVTKASNTETTQDAGLPLGNVTTATLPAYGALDDTKGITAADALQVVDANRFLGARTWTHPVGPYATIGALLTFLGTKYLFGLQTINVPAGVHTEPATWPVHAQAGLIAINGATIPTPVTHADEVFTGLGNAAADVAATLVALQAKVPTYIDFTVTRLLLSQGGAMLTLRNVLFNRLTVSALAGTIMGAWQNVFFMNGSYNSRMSSQDMQNVWVMSGVDGTAATVNGGTYNWAGGVFRGTSTGWRAIDATGVIQSGIVCNFVARGTNVGVSLGDGGVYLIQVDAPNTGILFHGNDAARLYSNVYYRGVPTSLIEFVSETATTRIGSTFKPDLNSSGTPLRFETKGLSSNAVTTLRGSAVEFGSATHQFVTAAANVASHIRLGDNSTLGFSSIGSTFTGGSPPANIQVGKLCRVALAGTVTTVNVPLDTLMAAGATSGSYVTS